MVHNTPEGGSTVNFLFTCGWCATECVLYGEPVASWWTPKFWLPDEFECWWCGGDSTVPAPPWTEAD